MTSQKDNGMQYYVMNQNLNNEKDIDNRKFHRHCVHPSREQLSFDELGKVYANISRRRKQHENYSNHMHSIDSRAFFDYRICAAATAFHVVLN